MAKKRKKTATRRKSRRVSGIGKGFFMDALGIVAGAAAARVLTSSPKILPNLDAKVKSAGVIAVGAFFPRFIKGDLGKSIGQGMIAAGGLGLLQATNVLGAMEQYLEIPTTVITGDDLSVIAGDAYGSDNLSVIAGMDESEF